jgi:hypothetical protein
VPAVAPVPASIVASVSLIVWVPTPSSEKSTSVSAIALA